MKCSWKGVCLKTCQVQYISVLSIDISFIPSFFHSLLPSSSQHRIHIQTSVIFLFLPGISGVVYQFIGETRERDAWETPHRGLEPNKLCVRESPRAAPPPFTFLFYKTAAVKLCKLSHASESILFSRLIRKLARLYLQYNGALRYSLEASSHAFSLPRYAARGGGQLYSSITPSRITLRLINPIRQQLSTKLLDFWIIRNYNKKLGFDNFGTTNPPTIIDNRCINICHVNVKKEQAQGVNKYS